MTFSQRTRALIDAAIEEDLDAAGDRTSALLDDPDAPARGRIVARQSGVLAGVALIPHVCRRYAQRLSAAPRFEPAARDGERLAAGRTLGTLAGPRAAILTCERVCLNFLARLSGIATLTSRFVAAAREANPRVRILDTRKTTPAWRELERYAVRCGGGHNHRSGLFDAVLIKDNHLAGIAPDRLADALRAMVGRAGAQDPPPAFVEVEVDDLRQLEAALSVDGIDVVLLDNFSPDRLRQAVALRNTRAPHVSLEASGGVTLETIGPIAATGVDRISVGALTHSARWLDLSLEMEA